MACCQDKRDTLAAIEDNLYLEQMSTISTCELNFYITRDGALTVIDKDSMSGDYFRCADCGFENRISLYSSYDGKVKYPVKAYKKMLNLVYSARVYQYSELNFGTFIYIRHNAIAPIGLVAQTVQQTQNTYHWR